VAPFNEVCSPSEHSVLLYLFPVTFSSLIDPLSLLLRVRFAAR
jgi:hypothetical protein